jgi:hypothetical protein
MNGPVKMFVAAALDEMMAGTLLADVSEPLYVNTLAPDSDKAVAVDDGVIGPTMFIVAADEHANPTAPDPPNTDPDTLILVAAVDTAIAAPPPVIVPDTVKVCPLNSIDIKPELPELRTPPPVILPLIVKFPADWFIV